MRAIAKRLQSMQFKKISLQQYVLHSKQEEGKDAWLLDKWFSPKMRGRGGLFARKVSAVECRVMGPSHLITVRWSTCDAAAVRCTKTWGTFRG